MGQCGSGMHEIIPGLWLGDADTADNYKLLLSKNIRFVVNISGEKYSKNENIQYMNLKVADTPTANLKRFFFKTSDFIDQGLHQNKAVFVHCLMGVSRSSSIVIAYLMIHRNMSFQTALELVRSKRSCVQPNPGFVKQLLQLETFLKQRNN